MKKDGVFKNWEVVRGQIDAYLVECGEIQRKIEQAPTVWRKIHHASAYLEEAIDIMPRLWFYLWAPKWALVAWLVLRSP
jgi:hypothetical protein